MSDSSQVVLAPDNGGVTASMPPCPLNDLPENLHQYIHALEQRITKLESEQSRFANALKYAGKFIFDSPMSKMMLSALPKDAQIKLKEYFTPSNAVTEKS